MDKNIETRLAELEARVKALETIGATGALASNQTTKKKQSPKEFLLSEKLSSVVQITLALGYFYEHELDKGAFNIADLETMFRLAKERVPANINDMVNKNIQKGLLMEDAARKADKKAWVLTATGERFVKNKFKEA